MVAVGFADEFGIDGFAGCPGRVPIPELVAVDGDRTESGVISGLDVDLPP